MYSQEVVSIIVGCSTTFNVIGFAKAMAFSFWATWTIRPNRYLINAMLIGKDEEEESEYEI